MSEKPTKDQYGNWDCGSKTHFHSREESAQSCMKDREAAPPQPSAPPSNAWTCAVCGTKNHIYLSQCMKCNTDLATGVPSANAEPNEPKWDYINDCPEAAAAGTPQQDALIAQVLERRALWSRLYPLDYIQRHFTLYDGELQALLDFAASRASGTAPDDAAWKLEHMQSQRDYLQRVCSKIQKIIEESDLPERSSELDVLPSSVAQLAQRAASGTEGSEALALREFKKSVDNAVTVAFLSMTDDLGATDPREAIEHIRREFRDAEMKFQQQIRAQAASRSGAAQKENENG